MSEVELLYKNAGIKKVRQTNIAGGDYPIAVGFEDYPPFTAEKQLSLIKWLSIEYSFVSNYVKKYNEYILQVDDFYSTKKDFSNALANLIIVIWQDLTEDERTEIRSILNG